MAMPPRSASEVSWARKMKGWQTPRMVSFDHPQLRPDRRQDAGEAAEPAEDAADEADDPVGEPAAARHVRQPRRHEREEAVGEEEEPKRGLEHAGVAARQE